MSTPKTSILKRNRMILIVYLGLALSSLGFRMAATADETKSHGSTLLAKNGSHSDDSSDDSDSGDDDSSGDDDDSSDDDDDSSDDSDDDSSDDDDDDSSDNGDEGNNTDQEDSKSKHSQSNSDNDKWVQAHNEVRQQLNAGEVKGQPRPAHPLPNVTGDPALAQVAQRYASQCNWMHNRRASEEYQAASGRHDKVGENIYASSGEGQPTASKVVDSWFSEHSSYNYQSNSCSGVCGHYTQVVWSDSVKVGCATVFCPSMANLGFGNAWFAVCDYAPAGNYIGERPY